jgi:excisionase family DNA binding protein
MEARFCRHDNAHWRAFGIAAVLLELGLVGGTLASERLGSNPQDIPSTSPSYPQGLRHDPPGRTSFVVSHTQEGDTAAVLPLLLTVRQAAVVLGQSERRVRRWIADGHIPPTVVRRFGRAMYLVRPLLEQWALGARDGTPPQHQNTDTGGL